MSELPELERAISAELEDQRAELASVRTLIDRLFGPEPDAIEIRAIAATLHAYYNGVERVFVLVAKHFKEPLSDSPAWHRDLLRTMADATQNRPSVISVELQAELTEMLAFRHFFRHSYPMRLNPDLIQPLIKKLAIVPAAFEREVQRFLETVKTADSSD